MDEPKGLGFYSETKREGEGWRAKNGNSSGMVACGPTSLSHRHVMDTKKKKAVRGSVCIGHRFVYLYVYESVCVCVVVLLCVAQLELGDHLSTSSGT